MGGSGCGCAWQCGGVGLRGMEECGRGCASGWEPGTRTGKANRGSGAALVARWGQRLGGEGCSRKGGGGGRAEVGGHPTTGLEPRGQRDFQGVPPAHPRKDNGVEGEEHWGAHDTPGLEPEWHQLEPK